MIPNIIGWCLFGLIAGAIVRFLMPGSAPRGCLATIALGIAGSFCGGFLGRLIWPNPGGGFEPAGLLGAIIGGMVMLWFWRKMGAD